MAKRAGPSVYALLDRCARRWWWFQQLRKWGRHAEARELERKSIRGHARDLRTAQRERGFVAVRPHGWTLHIDRNRTLSAPDNVRDCVPQAAIRVGLPVIDTTKARHGVLRCPDPRPGSYDAAFACAKKLGAKTWNWRPGRAAKP